MASDASSAVPGFDFLQALVKQNTGIGLPGFGQWVAPTLNPEELEKRIEELKTVQFWLEQNARLLGTTIQALEVQRMTLTTLKTMNVQMSDLRDALMTRPPEGGTTDAKPSPPTPTPVDPMQWWSALTQQFAELASATLREGALNAQKLAGGLAGATAPAADESRP